MLKLLPPAVRIPLKLLASAGFATVTIILCVLVLAWSTLLGHWYDLPVLNYGIYGTWWFALLLLLLGINVVAATVVKLPWRRSQTGFLVVHAGIIVLLIGCWLSWEQGIEGQLGVAEGATFSVVTEDAKHFQLRIVDTRDGKEPKEKTIKIPFQSGPFNWSDYQHLGWFPWHLARRDRGTLYDQDGVKLEVLDYMSNSQMVPVPELVLRTQVAKTGMASMMKEGWGTGQSEFTLSARHVSSHGMLGGQAFTVGSHHQLPTGELVTFRLVESQAAVRAFLDDRPKVPFGPLGQVVLHVAGSQKSGSDSKATVYRFSLEEMIDQDIVKFGDTSLRAQVTQFIPEQMRVRLAVYDTKKPGVSPRILSLNAFQPNHDIQDPTGQVIGSFWFSPPDEDDKAEAKTEETDKAKPANKDPAADRFLEAIDRVSKKHPMIVFMPSKMSSAKVNQLLVVAELPRVDLIQGPDIEDAETTPSKHLKLSSKHLKLYVREWDGRQIVSAGSFDPHAKKIEWFASSRQPVRVKVIRFLPSASPGEMAQAIPYQKKALRLEQRAKVRLTVGKKEETFWLSERSSDTPSQWNKAMTVDDRSVSVALRRDEIELGFGVHLDDFTIEYSPGSTTPSRYTSQIDFVKLKAKSENNSKNHADKNNETADAYENDVSIEVNYPAPFRDPSSGRVYRFFQTSYRGPFRPGDPEFNQFVGGKQKRDTLYLSYFTVTSDPGRFWKYAGCFMIVFGIAIMYYMKAYFFRRFVSRMEEAEH